MRAAVFQSVGKLVVQEQQVPQPGPGEALVRVVRCGVCATDVHIHHGVFPARMPVIGGHELAGTVEAVGAPTADANLIGQRVAVDPLLYCGRCHFCRSGRRNHCRQTGAIGVTRNGGFAQWVVVPAAQVYPVGELDFAAAAMAEPLACVLWGLKMVGDLVGRNVLIVGAGPIGLLWLLVARRAGAARIVIADRLSDRLSLARRLGADATAAATLPDADGERALGSQAEFGFDVAIDATGQAAVVGALPRLVGPGGTVSCFGVCPPEQTIAISPYDVYRRDLRIVGGYAINETFASAVALLCGGAIDARPLVSHALPLANLAHALDELVGTERAVKVQIAPND